MQDRDKTSSTIMLFFQFTATQQQGRQAPSTPPCSRSQDLSRHPPQLVRPRPGQPSGDLLELKHLMNWRLILY